MSLEPKVTRADPGALRLFIAVSLPEEVKSAVLELQRELQTTLGGRDVRWLKPGQLHLTLRFLGDVPAAMAGELRSALVRCVAGVAGFELTLGGLGCFPSARRARVLWLGFQGQLDALRALQSDVRVATKAWGRSEDREFHPHLTLARLAEHARFDSRGWQELERRYESSHFGTWRVGTVQLMKSELQPAGAIYSTLATCAFGTKVPTG